MQLKSLSVMLLAPVILMLSPFALAHTGGGHMAGLADGFMHPVTGLDHLLIAIAAGFWAGRRGDRGHVSRGDHAATLLMFGLILRQVVATLKPQAETTP